MSADPSIFEKLDATLDAIASTPMFRMEELTGARHQIDKLYDAGALADHEWRVLVNKAKRIENNALGAKS